MLEAQSTHSPPQFLIPSLESISGPVKCFLHFSNQAPPVSRSCCGSSTENAISVEKRAIHVHGHQPQILRVHHRCQADLDPCRVKRWSASKKKMLRGSPAAISCATNLLLTSSPTLVFTHQDRMTFPALASDLSTFSYTPQTLHVVDLLLHDTAHLRSPRLSVHFINSSSGSVCRCSFSNCQISRNSSSENICALLAHPFISDVCLEHSDLSSPR